MYRKSLILLLLSAVMAGCAGDSSKRHYAITATSLHRYQPGDYIEYQIDGDRLNLNDGTYTTIKGRARVSYQDAALNNLPITDQALLAETTVVTLSDGDEQTRTRFVAQDPDGNLRFFAVSDSSNVYWLSDDGTSFGLMALFSPLDNASPDLDLGGNIGMMDCGSGSCSTGAVGSVTNNLIRDGVDTVTTPLAIFDTYRIKRYWDSQPPSGLLENSESMLWVFPPLGIVKFSVQTTDSNTQLTYFASITSTNIDLPSPG